MTVAGDKIAEARKRTTTPGAYGRPKYLLDREVDPTWLALYKKNPAAWDVIDTSAMHQYEALYIPSETAYALSAGGGFLSAERGVVHPSHLLDPADLRDMTDEDRAALEELASIVVDQNPFLRERKIRTLAVWALPPDSPDGAPAGTWEHAFDALARGLPVSVIERGVVEAVKVRQADPSVSPTELGALFSGVASPEEVSGSVFGVGQTSRSIVGPVVFGAGAGLLAASAFGGPVGWAVGGTVAVLWWLFS